MDLFRLSQLMKERRVGSGEIALALGKTKAIGTSILNGSRKVTSEEVVKIAKLLDCPAGVLLGEKEEKKPSSAACVPIVGDVPGHTLALQGEPDGCDRIFVDSKRVNLLAVRLKGESMNKIAHNGSILIIDCENNDPSKLNGKLVIARLRNRYTFQRFFTFPTLLAPESNDIDYSSIPVRAGDDFEIIGEVVASMHLYDKNFD
ncbi:MAG: S24 family peptidase [Rickettsiales bacterium]